MKTSSLEKVDNLPKEQWELITWAKTLLMLVYGRWQVAPHPCTLQVALGTSPLHTQSKLNLSVSPRSLKLAEWLNKWTNEISSFMKSARMWFLMIRLSPCQGYSTVLRSWWKCKSAQVFWKTTGTLFYIYEAILNQNYQHVCTKTFPALTSDSKQAETTKNPAVKDWSKYGISYNGKP